MVQSKQTLPDIMATARYLSFVPSFETSELSLTWSPNRYIGCSAIILNIVLTPNWDPYESSRPCFTHRRHTNLWSKYKHPSVQRARTILQASQIKGHICSLHRTYVQAKASYLASVHNFASAFIEYDYEVNPRSSIQVPIQRIYKPA